MNKRLFLAFCLSLCVSVSFVSAVNIGISPASADLRGVLRGGYAERLVRISLDTEDDTKVAASTWGEIADWINISDEAFEVSRSNPHTLTVSVRPPSGTPNGNYEGFVRIQSEKTGEPVGDRRATGIVIPVLDLHVRVEVTDQEARGCRASDFKVSHVEEGDDVIFSLNIRNTGNIWFSPLINLNIWDQDSTRIVKQIRHSDTQVTPTKEERVFVTFPSDDLEVGQYWVEAAAVDCYNEQTLTFDVLEEGALRASGVLKEIKVPTWSDEGETIPILATFANDGEKPVRSQFKGRVTLQNKIVQLMESDGDTFVDVGEEGEYLFYFTPKQPGRYLVSGRVFYDGKRTYEKGAAFNIRSKSQFFDTIIKILTYLVLIAVIAFLFTKIRKERKSYERRLRRVR